MAEIEFQPDWMTFEIEAALREIGGQHIRKKRTTILLLADASASGRPMKGIFAMPETCSETTWYGRYEGGEKKPGWCDDPIIRKVLKLATQRANYCADSYITKQIEETKRTLATYGPPAAHKLGGLMLKANSESLQRLAALDILDRQAGGETASKSAVPNTSGDLTLHVVYDDGPDDKAEETA